MIVNASSLYNSSTLERDINSLINKYSFLKKEIIGYSFLGTPIYSLIFGKGSKEILYVGSTHANESITSTLLMKFLDDISYAYSNGSNINYYNTQEIFNNTSLYIVPMLNPDGVDLVNGNINKLSNAYIYAKIISNNYPNIPFPDGWKANINGVDLNLQFPAEWLKAKEIKYSQCYRTPAPRDFVGLGPLTEPESLAIYNYTLKHNFSLMITYHTQGKEIYWQFQNYAPESSYKIGQKFAEVSGYTLTDVPYESGFAGFKDWFLQEYRKPAFTIEAGSGTNPLPITQFDEIYKNNLPIMILGTLLA